MLCNDPPPPLPPPPSWPHPRWLARKDLETIIILGQSPHLQMTMASVGSISLLQSWCHDNIKAESELIQTFRRALGPTARYPTAAHRHYINVWVHKSFCSSIALNRIVETRHVKSDWNLLVKPKTAGNLQRKRVTLSLKMISYVHGLFHHINCLHLL